jgi:hypothetical protein
VLVILAALGAIARAIGQWPSAAAAVGLLALGAAASALPASVLRGSGEMERPIVSSLVWSAFSLGAGLALALAPW